MLRKIEDLNFDSLLSPNGQPAKVPWKLTANRRDDGSSAVASRIFMSIGLQAVPDVFVAKFACLKSSVGFF
ncbi:hypothetical protein NC651_029513 [Populus alba x Populus x berolinensis]|nr:hypothetical protein NC651_029513 [Populus alba x Populus x berolinensis]